MDSAGQNDGKDQTSEPVVIIVRFVGHCWGCVSYSGLQMHMFVSM